MHLTENTLETFVADVEPRLNDATLCLVREVIIPYLIIIYLVYQESNKTIFLRLDKPG